MSLRLIPAAISIVAASAIGNEAQIKRTSPIRDSSHATGTRIANWRHILTRKVFLGLPSDWKDEDSITVYAPKGRDSAHILTAAIPMAYIFSDALNNPSRGRAAMI